MTMRTETRLTQSAAGCDDCAWEPRPHRGLAYTRGALRRHAQSKGHATYLLAESCTNYDARPKAGHP